jgi:hypothetical protein
MLQMRPNGRCLDHYRIALDGTVLETQVVATSAFRAPVLAQYRLTYQAWPRDLKIRRNMTTTAWVDSFLAISANNVLVSTDDKGDAVPPEEIKSVFAFIKEMSMKSASTRYAFGGRPGQTHVVGTPDLAWDSGGPDVEADLRWVSVLYP